MKKRLFTTALAATVLAALLCPAMSAQQRIEVSWAELARAFDGRVVSTVLLDGTVVQGRVLDVSPGELRFEVKKTSNRELYPKGELALARGQVSVFSYTERRGYWRALGTAIGAGGAAAATSPSWGWLLENKFPQKVDVNAGVVLVAGVIGASAAIGYGLGRAADKRTTSVIITHD